MLQKCFGTLPQICADTILSQSSTDNSFNLMALCFLCAFSDMHNCGTVGPYIDRSVLFQITSNQLNVLQVDSIEVVETVQV
jgi:hypothetical protein